MNNKYIKAQTVHEAGGRIVKTIAGINLNVEGKFGTKNELVFDDETILTLNAFSETVLAESLPDETDDWVGIEVVLVIKEGDPEQDISDSVTLLIADEPAGDTDGDPAEAVFN